MVKKIKVNLLSLYKSEINSRLNIKKKSIIAYLKKLN